MRACDLANARVFSCRKGNQGQQRQWELHEPRRTKRRKKFLFARSLDNFSPDNLPLVPQEHNPKDYQFISLSTTHHSHPLDKLSQLCKLDRLGQVMIDSTAHRLFLCLRRCQAGEGDYLGRFEALFLLVAADFARCREAVHDGHGNIHQHVVE